MDNMLKLLYFFSAAQKYIIEISFIYFFNLFDVATKHLDDICSLAYGSKGNHCV